MKKKFQIVVCDPAWSFFDKLTMSDVARGAEANYPVMSNQDILNLKVKELADPEGCVLALWVPSSLLPFGLQVMETWGFTVKQNYIWVKIKNDPLEDIKDIIVKSLKNIFNEDKLHKRYFKNIKKEILYSISNFSFTNMLSFGMGRLFRNTHEICLIGINNTKIYKKLQNKSQRTVSFAPNLKHSAKPEDLQNSLELMFPDIPNEPVNKIELFARRQRPNWTCLGNEIDGSDIRDAIEKLI